jgi:hypothetical protein
VYVSAVQRMRVEVGVITKTLNKYKDLELFRNISCHKFNKIYNLKKYMHIYIYIIPNRYSCDLFILLFTIRDVVNDIS